MESERKVIFRKDGKDGLVLEVERQVDVHGPVRIVLSSVDGAFSINLDAEEAWKLRQALYR